MNSTLILQIITLAVAIGIIVFVFNKKKLQVTSVVQDATDKAETIKKEAQQEADRVLRRAKQDAEDIIEKRRAETERELRERRESINQIERRILEKEKHVDHKEESLIQRENRIRDEYDSVKQLKERQEQLTKSLIDKLETVSGFSQDQAREQLLSNIERDVRKRAGNMIKEIQAQAKKVANRKAKEIITDAIQRTAVDHIVPATTSTVELPDEELKGRIIGKEGRNIRAFEGATGVDVIIDDSPNTVVLSSFDPIRRETARRALQALVQDGRIHPTRIEEAVEKAKEELHDFIIEKGEQALDELGLQVHPKIVELVGKLHFRTSYGQNMLQHAVEAAHVAAIMAADLGVNVNLAKRGALLHDIGKAIDFEQGGSHTDLGKEICEKYGESDEVINCIMAHHEDEEPETIEAVIVMVADALSSARPGARRESVETYIKRLEKLEGLAKQYDGVDKAYAIQAGREIRVIVKPNEIDDPGMHKLALDMAHKIEQELDYPGEIKVSLVRETRASSTAH